jgi:hypothetical protein
MSAPSPTTAEAPALDEAPTTAEVIRSTAAAYRALITRITAPGAAPASFDNRPTWDNTGGRFDNRPTWDNWSNR